MRFSIVLLTILMAFSCSHSKIPCPDGKTIILQTCNPQIKYSGTSFEIGSIQIPDINNFKVEGIKFDQKVLLQATEAAQLLDQFRMSYCQTLNRLGCDATNRDIIYLAKYQQRLYELQFLLLKKDYLDSKVLENILTEWIAASTINASRDLGTKKRDISGGDNVDEKLIIQLLTSSLDRLNISIEDDKKINILSRMTFY